MKLVLDMNLTPRWVAYLTRSGFESVHWSEVGPKDATDAEIIAAALKQAEPALSEGALVSVDPKRARLRMLPLSSGS